ncbi:DUF1287 domain-containing protein [Bifidobacterium moraviense]|nr:DUF1287 domain-containing protein [Bifidobacterium sp. DSM 109958]
MREPSLRARRRRRAIAVAVAVALIASLVGAGALVARAWIAGLGSTLDGIAGITSVAGRVGSSATPWTTDPPNFTRVASPVDYNGNGVDDYTDILDGARRDAEALPAYDDGYYAGGYPPADRGACTDLVWRAFAAAGYDLKAMVDADVTANPKAYASVAPRPDPNIDFRRTGVLGMFLSRYGQTLTDDPADYAQWQPGDIVVFETVRHIAVVSDRHSASTGTAYLLHNMGDDHRENDYLDQPGRMQVTGHYRFDASKVPSSVLRAWKG